MFVFPLSLIIIHLGNSPYLASNHYLRYKDFTLAMKKESFTHKKKNKKKTCPRAEKKKQTNITALPHYPEFDYESENKAANGQNMSTD